MHPDYIYLIHATIPMHSCTVLYRDDVKAAWLIRTDQRQSEIIPACKYTNITWTDLTRCCLLS